MSTTGEIVALLFIVSLSARVEVITQRRLRRRRLQKVKDFVTFPVRAFTLFHDDRFGLSSLASERFDYVAAELAGYCLDVGCGRKNRFINEYLGGHGRGVDIFRYEGLTDDNMVEDLSRFPFPDSTFESVTFIANMNHIPKPQRDQELSEAYRVLKREGNVVVTMGNPLAEVVVHKVVWIYDKLLGTTLDMDSERGMGENEAYYLRDSEIVDGLTRAGFQRLTRKRFPTQWGLNHLFVGWKD